MADQIEVPAGEEEGVEAVPEKKATAAKTLTGSPADEILINPIQSEVDPSRDIQNNGVVGEGVLSKVLKAMKFHSKLNESFRQEFDKIGDTLPRPQSDPETVVNLSMRGPQKKKWIGRFRREQIQKQVID